MSFSLEIIWWLHSFYHVPMDIIRYIMIEWIYYPPIEDNDQFRENIRLWFNKNKYMGNERNVMIKKYGYISEWNTKNITDMSLAFGYNETFNEDLSRWNVCNVEYMTNMFNNCKSFTSDLSHWNVSHVKDMRFMFYNCEEFQSDLSNWNVTNTQYFTNMLINCPKFDCDLSVWGIHKRPNL